jgi:hypothetical protein
MEPTELTAATARRLEPHAAERLARTDCDLANRAAAVLEANWMGHATRASARLYPHQWSWDSACIAIGYSGWDQDRAQAELRWLFAGQWADGLLPHIRFAPDARYFPGPEFWQTHLSALAPREPQTSGIVQPPVHATAVWKVFRHARDGEEAKRFLRELQPKLVAWHEYLYRERTRGDDGLVEIWHPWESGMDNSPLWDDALAQISPPPEAIPLYERVDVEFVDANQRPTNDHYDRYAYLVKLYRDWNYEPERIRDECPFVVRDVLFNSLLVQANRDLAEISRVVGADPEPFEAWADRTAAGLAVLWDEADATYFDVDVRAGRVAFRAGSRKPGPPSRWARLLLFADVREKTTLATVPLKGWSGEIGENWGVQGFRLQRCGLGLTPGSFRGVFGRSSTVPLQAARTVTVNRDSERGSGPALSLSCPRWPRADSVMVGDTREPGVTGAGGS